MSRDLVKNSDSPYLNKFGSGHSGGQETEFLATTQVNSGLGLRAIFKGNIAIKGMKRDKEKRKRQRAKLPKVNQMIHIVIYITILRVHCYDFSTSAKILSCQFYFIS